MFKASNLSVLAYANNFTLWHYRHEGLTIDVGADGFFNKASDMVRVGDRIILQADDAVRDVTITKVSDGIVCAWLPGVFGVGFNSSVAEEDKARLQATAFQPSAPAIVSAPSADAAVPSDVGADHVQYAAAEGAEVATPADEANVAPAAEVQTAA